MAAAGASVANSSKHTTVALTLLFFTASVFILSIISLVSPYWQWLDNQPGTADNNAETLVDRYQGLWYSCVFFIQGTAAGVNIERRVCQETSSLTPGTNIPDQLVGIQVLSVIGVALSFFTMIFSWAAAKPAVSAEDARGNRTYTVVSAICAAFGALVQFIALVMYATDPYITTARSAAVDVDYYIWGSGFNSLVTAFVFGFVAVVLASWGSCVWAARANVLPSKVVPVVAVPARTGTHATVVVYRDPLDTAAAPAGSAVALIAEARTAGAAARSAWADATRDLANGTSSLEQLDAAVALSQAEIDAADAAQAKAEEESAAESSAATRRAIIYAAAQATQARKRFDARHTARSEFIAAQAAQSDAAQAASAAAAVAAAERSSAASEAALVAATHAGDVPSAGAAVEAAAAAEEAAEEEAAEEAAEAKADEEDADAEAKADE